MKVYDSELEYVLDFPYPGAMVTDDGWADLDIASRADKESYHIIPEAQ